jgi:putative nucleic acid binding protein
MNKATLAIIAALSVSIALADDFQTIDGKEYKNAKVSRVEPDGIVITFSGGIVKLPFIELPGDVQKKYGYDSTAAAAFTAEQAASDEAFSKQRKEAEQRRAEERARYWNANPTPAQSDKLNTFGSSLDRRAYNQSTTAEFLCLQYAQNEIAADKQYRGRVFTISGTIKNISMKGETADVELFVPLTQIGKTWFMDCNFNDTRGLEKYQAGNPISFTGTVAGVDGRTLEVKDCELMR